MLNLLLIMEIEILFKRGWSIRKIARQMNLSRNTIKKYLKTNPSMCHNFKQQEKPTKLDNYKSYTKKRFESGLPDFIPATVIYKEIKSQGYEGGVRMLRYYLSELKSNYNKAETIVRFETSPGKQLQVDWCEVEKNRINAFVATLGYSRFTYVEFTDNMKEETLQSCLMNCFNYIAGVPQEILFDNMKTVINKRDHYAKGKHQFNKMFYDFAKHYGFVIKMCQPYRAQTKGKVERFNDYLQRSFYLPLKSSLKISALTVDVTTANLQVKKWLEDEANIRIHATIKERPIDRLKEEKGFLQLIPPEYKITQNIAKESMQESDEKILFSHYQENNNLQHDLNIYQQLIG